RKAVQSRPSFAREGLMDLPAPKTLVLPPPAPGLVPAAAPPSVTGLAVAVAPEEEAPPEDPGAAGAGVDRYHRSTGRVADRMFRLLTGSCAAVVAALILVAIVFLVH